MVIEWRQVECRESSIDVVGRFRQVCRQQILQAVMHSLGLKEHVTLNFAGGTQRAVNGRHDGTCSSIDRPRALGESTRKERVKRCKVFWNGGIDFVNIDLVGIDELPDQEILDPSAANAGNPPHQRCEDVLRHQPLEQHE